MDTSRGADQAAQGTRRRRWARRALTALLTVVAVGGAALVLLVLGQAILEADLAAMKWDGLGLGR